MQTNNNLLFGPVVVNVVKHLLHALPLRAGQMRPIALRGFCGRDGRRADAPFALFGRHDSCTTLSVCARNATCVGVMFLALFTSLSMRMRMDV